MGDATLCEDPDFPHGGVADCDFSDEDYGPWFVCAKACSTFNHAKIYALSFIETYRVDYVIVTTTGISDLPFGVFMDRYTAQDIERWSDESVPEEHRVHPVDWQEIPKNRQALCGRLRHEAAA